jgi:hypothetical protein
LKIIQSVTFGQCVTVTIATFFTHLSVGNTLRLITIGRLDFSFWFASFELTIFCIQTLKFIHTMDRLMTKPFITLAVLLLFTASGANAMNRCTQANGNITFQDAPCEGKGVSFNAAPASGYSQQPKEPQKSVEVSPPKSQTVIAKEQLASLQDERMRREKWFVLNDRRGDLVGQRNSCEREQRALRESKANSNNNLAGVTRDASISSEMAAAATVCDGKLREIERQLSAAERVCAEIKCIAPK